MLLALRCGIAILSTFLVAPTVFAQSMRATEKEALYTYITVHTAKGICPGIEFNTEAMGWFMIGLFQQRSPEYVNTWFSTAKDLVDVAANFPTFCADVKSAYGPQGIPVKTLPWATPDFRGMLK